VSRWRSVPEGKSGKRCIAVKTRAHLQNSPVACRRQHGERGDILLFLDRITGLSGFTGFLIKNNPDNPVKSCNPV
jgi:hypothetical protein